MLFATGVNKRVRNKENVEIFSVMTWKAFEIKKKQCQLHLIFSRLIVEIQCFMEEKRGDDDTETGLRETQNSNGRREGALHKI